MKLQYLCKFFEAAGSGVDPSSKAVEAGNERLLRAGISDIALSVSTADALPLEKEEFDLVYFAFCLYLVDRNNLFATIAEADRVLKPGGYLAIVDFDPDLTGKICTRWNERESTWRKRRSCPSRGTSQSKS